MQREQGTIQSSKCIEGGSTSASSLITQE